PGILKVIEDVGGVFHPKISIGFSGAEARVLVGSSNFTSGGFEGNTELNVLIEGRVEDDSIAEMIAFGDQQWRHPRAFEPGDEWLTRYEQAYESRPRPKPLPRGGGSGRKILVRTQTDLDIEWADYFALIEQQERRTLSNGYPIH